MKIPEVMTKCLFVRFNDKGVLLGNLYPPKGLFSLSAADVLTALSAPTKVVLLRWQSFSGSI
jgi:hypothetical protein